MGDKSHLILIRIQKLNVKTPPTPDESGNGYTLVAGGSLAGHVVDPRGKLATEWGSLKRRARF